LEEGIEEEPNHGSIRRRLPVCGWIWDLEFEKCFGKLNLGYRVFEVLDFAGTH